MVRLVSLQKQNLEFRSFDPTVGAQHVARTGIPGVHSQGQRHLAIGQLSAQQLVSEHWSSYLR